MDLEKLTDRIFYCPHDAGTDRPLLAYVRGDKYALAVDAGCSERHTRAFYEALRARGMRPPDFTVLTHWHFDHTLGMCAAAGLTVACDKTAEYLETARKNFAAPAYTEQLRREDAYFAKEYARETPQAVLPDIRFDSEMLIDLGGITAKLFRTESPHTDDSVTYLNIYYFGLPFLILYNLGTGIFSALGDSRTPFLFLVFSSVSNIVLDYCMVQPWGVAGVAWATFIAQGAACVLTLVFVLRRVSKLRTEGSEKMRVFSGTLLKMLVLLAIPVALQNSFVSVGNLIIQVKINELANAQGIGITNGFTAGFKLLVFSTTCFCTCANGLTNFVSQNFGAHKFRRIKRGFYAALIISTLLTAVFAFSTFFFAEPLVRLFMPEGEADALALSSGAQFIRIAAFFFFAVNVKVVADGTVRGCNGNVGFMVSTFTDLILRVAFVFILTPLLGFAGVGWAWAVGWTLGTGVALGFYFTIPCLRKRNMSRYDEEGNLLAQPAPAAETDAAQ